MKADKKIITAFIILAFILLVLNIVAHAAEDSLKKAMEKYETHRYSEGIALLKKEIDGRQKDELVLPYFILSRFYLKEAELYRTMYETSLMTTNDYLIKLNSVRTGKKSKYLPYFMGLLYLETGQAKKGAASLQQFVNNNSVEMAQNSINLSQKNGNKNHSKKYREIAFIYYKNDMSDAALGLMDKIELNEPEVLDNVEKNKVVRFYDPALLNDMSRIYYYAAGKYFNKVMSLRGREKYEDLIRFYLSEVNYRLNRYDDAINEINGFLKSNKLDAKYNKKINVLLGACYYKKGNKKQAIEIWDDLLNKNQQDDGAISALMDAYAELNVEASPLLKKTEGQIASKDEKKMKPFYNSLGLLYYSKKDYEKSVQALELARDKANKNKIEANDPVFLIRLANSYYRLRKYSEALAIFFELGKAYPVVRQIQDTIQGVYSADEKGSGDVRIY